jgi:hypothetical protein
MEARDAMRLILEAMDLLAKLQIRPGSKVAVLGAPEDLDLVGPWQPINDPIAADAAIVFVKDRDELAATAAAAIDAARQDRLTWIAYPKSGQLGTDLNRDVLREILAPAGIQPVRQVAIDDIWSALRFRPSGG